jgi:hypothetical protein
MALVVGGYPDLPPAGWLGRVRVSPVPCRHLRTIQNTGSQPLRSVVLSVTGASYNLGDIPPGATAHVTVHPTGESHLEIQFTDSDGQAHRLNAGGYFESGYRGTINISIKDDVIQENQQKISLRWSLP